MEERELNYKPDFVFYLWVFFFGSALGSVWEISWYFIRFLKYSTRTALVFGLWNILYGAGLVIMTLVLRPFIKKGGFVVFLVSLLVGSLVEFIASLGQEIVFGSTSWNYTKIPLNLFGRINLVYSIFWGLAGYFWMKYGYPRMKKMTLTLPRVAAWILFIFLIINILFSVGATFRWKARLEGAVNPTSDLERILDFFFNNEAMSFVYPNWHFGS